MHSPAQPTPLSHPQFYILLALAQSESLHGYAIKGAVNNLSLNTVQLNGRTFYPLLEQLTAEGLLDFEEHQPSRRSSRPQIHYSLTQPGKIRLQQELNRLDHALAAAKIEQLIAQATVAAQTTA